MRALYKSLRGRPLVVIPQDGFFVVFWRRGLVILCVYILIASFLGSTEFLDGRTQNIIDRVATFVILLLLMPLGMSIEHDDDFRRRDETRSTLSKTAFEK